MSEKRQSDSSENCDRKGKQIKYPDDKQLEAGGGNPSLSPSIHTPVRFNADHLSVHQTIAEGQCEGGLLEFMKQQEQAYLNLQQIHHPAHHYKTGNSSERETWPEPNGKAKIDDINSDVESAEEYYQNKQLILPDKNPRIYKLHSSHYYIECEKQLGSPKPLFYMLIPRSNRLPVPCDTAEMHFRFQPFATSRLTDHLQEHTLHLTDDFHCKWEMRFVCFFDEGVYVVVKGWDEYVDQYGLEPDDVIQFFRGFKISHKLRLEHGPPLPVYISPPLFMEKNLLYELKLTSFDVSQGRLTMQGFEIPYPCQTQEMVKFTDEKDKNWYMIIEKCSITWEHTIVNGWNGFVKEYELGPLDVVRIYMPIIPQHRMHFLIKCVKKKTEKKDDGSDPGQPGDGAGPTGKIDTRARRLLKGEN